jgi:hypothetical protein
MMQNSLRRLLEGTVRALVDDVTPAVEDPYARAQALAAADLLANLVDRVGWAPEYLLWWTTRARDLLAEALALAPGEPAFAAVARLLEASEPGPRAATEEVEEWAADHLAALAAAREWSAREAAGSALAPRLDSLADEMLDRDLAVLRRL